METIRIFNGCEVQIENSVMRVTVQHYKTPQWCWTVIQSQNFQFALNNHSEQLSCIFFSWILFLRKLCLSLNMYYFYRFYAKISTFSVKQCSFSTPTYDVDVKMSDGKCRMPSKPNVMSKWRFSGLHKSGLTCPRKTTPPCTGQLRGNSCQVCKKKNIPTAVEPRFQNYFGWLLGFG